MSFIEFFRNFFAYDLWSNRRVLSVLREQESVPADAVRLFAHILGAQKLWLKRMLGENYEGLGSWPDLTLDECAALIDEQHGRWMKYLDDNDDAFLDVTLAYSTTSGEPFVTSIRDILTHVNNHSTYHRAQIARILREQGVVPPVTDYVVYARDRS